MPNEHAKDAGFSAGFATDPRDRPQPAPGDPALKIAGPDTLIPVHELEKINLAPIITIERDRGLWETIAGGAVTVGDTFQRVGASLPSEYAARQYQYRLVFTADTAGEYLPGDLQAAPTAGLVFAADTHVIIEGFAALWVKLASSDRLCYYVARARFDV
jgi:hypothetical protein